MAPSVLESHSSPVTSSSTAVVYPQLRGHTPPSHQALLSILSSSAYEFLRPSPILHATALNLAKNYLDPLAAATSNAQEQRQHSARRKRKRGGRDGWDSQTPLRLKEIHLDGFSIGQVWEQARRVLDATTLEVQRSLPADLQEQHQFGRKSIASNNRQQKKPGVRFKDGNQNRLDGATLGTDEADDAELENDISLDEEENGFEEAEMDGADHMNGEAVNDYDEKAGDKGDMERDFYDEELDGTSQSNEESPEVFVPDKSGLNDGFFSIDEFNRQSEFLEQQDVRGDNDGAASDDEDVDWTADPLTAGAANTLGAQSHNEEAQESTDEEDGPTFGNADFNGPDISDDDDEDPGVEMDDTDPTNNTNDIKYADFFAPPPLEQAKSRRRALPKTQPPPSTTLAREPGASDEETQDLQRTISTVRRDIFEDESPPPSPSNSPNRSSHQKRQAALVDEIRRLEAASVAKRSWTLSGEARATDRPINSLLEEDLDFERAGKPIPVITQEVSEDIEAMIKRRILAREFDEVIRRRPGNLATGKQERRGRFELDDAKPQQSLVEMYEAEHLKSVDPNYTDPRDAKLRKEHLRVEEMWRDVCAQLDALSSYHYRPKPPSASINVVADVPTLSMEDARPSGAEGGSMLAPQEIYKAGDMVDKRTEVVAGGVPVGREEMSRENKLRRRRREKERIRKAGSGVMDAVKGGGEAEGGKRKGKGEESRVLGELKKGGVRIIGKKGEIRDVEGKSVGAQGTVKGGGGYKL